MDELKKTFRPEFLNRIDGSVCFIRWQRNRSVRSWTSCGPDIEVAFGERH